MCHDASRDERLKQLIAERDAAKDPQAMLEAEQRQHRRAAIGPAAAATEEENTRLAARLRALAERGAIGMLS